METLLPNTTIAAAATVYTGGAATFDLTNGFTQVAGLQFYQPVKMIRHHDPGQGFRQALVIARPELTNQQASQTPVREIFFT